MPKGKYVRDKSTEKTRERFWVKVDKRGKCWLWTAAQYLNGYGVFYIPWIGNQCAHRAAWILEQGPIPKGMFVLHHCDTPACVRLDHLFLGTPKDNTQDMVRKKRSTYGENHRLHKVTADQVIEIRRRVASGEVQRRCAEAFGLSPGQICNIVNGKCWSRT